MFKHKYLDHNNHNLMNTINYMSSQFKDGFTFAGFIPLVDDYFGVTIDGVCYTAVHLSTKPFRRILSDSEDKERKCIESGKSWVALLYGSDKLTELRQDESWLWYNS